jgi:hypothetical protein
MAPEQEPKQRRLRTGLAWTALVLGCLALLLANLAVFLKAFVFDQDTFTDAVAPKQPDETVSNGLANTLSSASSTHRRCNGASTSSPRPTTRWWPGPCSTRPTR